MKIYGTISILFTVILLTLTACSSPATTSELPQLAEPSPSEEPSLYSDVDKYTDATETINNSVGGEFAIALYTNPRLGTNWHETHDESMLSMIESDFIPFDTELHVDGTRYFIFKALKVGETEISLVYNHGTGGPVNDRQVFKVDIK